MMRILFSGHSAAGHILPMLDLQRAAERAGHDTAVISGAELEPMLPHGLRLLTVGPTMAELIAETMARPRGGDPSQPGPGAVELMAGTAVERTFSDALAATRTFAPDLLVCEAFDQTGPLVAAELRLPWVRHGISGPLPPELSDAFAARALEHYRQRSLAPTPPAVSVEVYPPILTGPDARRTQEPRIFLRPFAHADPAAATTWSAFPDDAPIVLLTLGTSIHKRDGDPLPALLTAAQGVPANVLVTASPQDIPEQTDAQRVRAVGFAPLDGLLSAADVVLGVGGTGTVLAALSAGVPAVIMPIKADQPLNAERAERLGVALSISEPTEATDALRRVLGTASFGDAARRVAVQLRDLPDADAVLADVLARVARRGDGEGA